MLAGNMVRVQALECPTMGAREMEQFFVSLHECATNSTMPKVVVEGEPRVTLEAFVTAYGVHPKYLNPWHPDQIATPVYAQEQHQPTYQPAYQPAPSQPAYYPQPAYSQSAYSQQPTFPSQSVPVFSQPVYSQPR